MSSLTHLAEVVTTCYIWPATMSVQAQPSKASPPFSTWVSTSTPLTCTGRRLYTCLLEAWVISFHQAQHSESRMFSSSYCKTVLIHSRFQQANRKFLAIYITITVLDSVRTTIPGSTGATAEMYGTRQSQSAAETFSSSARGINDDRNILQDIPVMYSSCYGRGERAHARTGTTTRGRFGRELVTTNLYVCVV